jgi:hypothetical protein
MTARNAATERTNTFTSIARRSAMAPSIPVANAVVFLDDEENTALPLMRIVATSV